LFCLGGAKKKKKNSKNFFSDSPRGPSRGGGERPIPIWGTQKNQFNQSVPRKKISHFSPKNQSPPNPPTQLIGSKKKNFFFFLPRLQLPRGGQIFSPPKKKKKPAKTRKGKPGKKSRPGGGGFGQRGASRRDGKKKKKKKKKLIWQLPNRENRWGTKIFNPARKRAEGGRAIPVLGGKT